MTPTELCGRTKAFALAVARTLGTAADSAGAGSRHAAGQVIRSSAAVAANYRAVGLARSLAEFTAKLGVVVEEADETVFWLEYLKESTATPDPTLDALLNEARQLVRIFMASRRTALRRRDSQRVPRQKRTRT
jgi:four helix bundle protein